MNRIESSIVRQDDDHFPRVIAESKRLMMTFCDRNANPNQRGATIYYIIYKKNNSLRIRINCF